MRTQNGARTRTRRVRQNKLAASNRNGKGKVRRRLLAAKVPPRAGVSTPGRINGNRDHAPTELAPSDPQFQAALKSFAAAAQYFQKHKYEKAHELFEKVLGSPARQLAERARVHLVLCERKLGRPAPAPKTADEQYDRGVAELNARHLEL